MATSIETTHTQRRAICAVCFAQQAVDARGRLAQHGYRRPAGWMQNVNTCRGAGRSHFGTEAGRTVTVKYAADLRIYADSVRADAAATLSGNLPLRNRKGIVIDATPDQLRRASEGLFTDAKHIDDTAADLDKLAAAWTPAEPVTVVVKTKPESLIHWRGGYWKDGRACAGSRMAAYKGQMSTDRAHVTCPKCIDRFERYPEAAR